MIVSKISIITFFLWASQLFSAKFALRIRQNPGKVFPRKVDYSLNHANFFKIYLSGETMLELLKVGEILFPNEYIDFYPI